MKQTLTLILSIFFLASCIKTDDSEPEPEATICEVKAIEFNSNGTATDKLFLTFNDNGKVTRIDHGVQNSNNYETFDYQSGKIVMFDSKNYYGKAETLTFNLDANSRITSVGNNTFKYNTDGYLIEAKETGNGVTSTFTFSYTSGNLTKIDYLNTYSGGTEKSTTLLEYNSDAYQSIGGFGSALVNFEFNGLGVLTEFYGKTPKNLIAKDTFKPSGGSDYVTTYSYQKNDKGKVVSMKLNQASSNNAEYKLTYYCK